MRNEGRVKKQEENNGVVAGVISEHYETLLSFFDTKPQTYEVGRSVGILLGLAWAHANAEDDNLNFEILETGSSGGLNLPMLHYHYMFSAENSSESWDMESGIGA